ncbi:chromate efflux transporter [Paraglaciecola sp.]|uniref:chromate efflux transporter n=1 Tax=Paraglaciecola sp. TaxID=1920173 RepID=UPI0030F425F7
MNKSQTVWEIFWRFLMLGCICFGGPAAHLGYFHRYFVERLAWLDAEHYGKLVALSQFLPGPGSSQMGFAIGLQRAGLAGGIAAFIGFTLPSFFLMFGFAGYILWSSNPDWMQALIHGLKLLAVVVVADAVLNMARQFCQSNVTKLLTLCSVILLLGLNAIYMQIAVLLIAATIGALNHGLFMPTVTQPTTTPPGHINFMALLMFVLLFTLSFILAYSQVASDNNLLKVAAQFYQSGSLVFGGGHVVLPLLQQSVGDALSSEQFLSGYAAAQGVPGPMFSLAAYLGALLNPVSPLSGALAATLALFMPGLLLIYALHQYWAKLANRPRIAGAVSAINASVVGILFSAWINPVLSNAVLSVADAGAVIIGLFLLKTVRLPIVVLLLLFAIYGLSGLSDITLSYKIF